MIFGASRSMAKIKPGGKDCSSCSLKNDHVKFDIFHEIIDGTAGSMIFTLYIVLFS